MLFFLQRHQGLLFRFVKFLMIGGSALLIDIFFYYIFTRWLFLPYLLGRAFSISIAIFWNFYLNRVWTFSASTGSMLSQFWKFLFVIGGTSLLNLLCMHIGVSVLGLNDIGVILGVSILLALVNFVAHLFWSYDTRED